MKYLNIISFEIFICVTMIAISQKKTCEQMSFLHIRTKTTINIIYPINLFFFYFPKGSEEKKYEQ